MSQSKIGFQARAHAPSSRSARRKAPALAATVSLGLIVSGLGGCTNWDSWFDPSVQGYWEHTPTQVPILRRLSPIEGPEDEYVEVSDVSPDDLLPDAQDYRIGPGDQLQIVLWDVPTPQQPTPFDRLVDHRGMVDLPQLGEVNLLNMTIEEARQALGRVMADKNLVNHDPLVSVTVTNPQQRMFTLMGAVGGPGPHYLPRADFRLLEAIADSGGISETVQELLVIRQIPLPGGTTLPIPQPQALPSGQQPNPGNNEHLIDLLDKIGGDQSGDQKKDQPKKPDDQPPPGGSFSVLADSGAARSQHHQPAAEPAKPSAPPADTSAPGTTWAFVNNQWVQVQAPPAPPAGSGTPPTADDGLPAVQTAATQRVIRVPVAQLLAGDPRYNIVVRPGDVIRVPNPANGTVYLGGEINRPGAFSMAPGLTLMRVIDAAGGMSSIGVPERVDIIRMTGADRQGMIRVDLRAINEGTQPDIYMKSNDRINVGTSFWAYPLAVMRGGFRASYGFGFILDRNFGNDIFGSPPFRAQGLINLFPRLQPGS